MPDQVALNSRSWPACGFSQGTRHPSAGRGLSAVSAPLSVSAALSGPETERAGEAQPAPRSAAHVQRRSVQSARSGRRGGRGGPRPSGFDRGCCAGAARCGRHPALATRWRCRPADAAGAGSCQKSRSQIGFSPPQGQGFGPSPSCHRHAATPHLPVEPSVRWAPRPRPRARPPASISRRELQRCAGIILVFHPLTVPQRGCKTTV